ncbi:hypothetical protein TREES_T100012939 [Tupaia chinensis]|uniref:Uncharacterized protein n=1 Tax=Tupaia chinensis TaxID=246437 RepID=L9L3N9_TUPCH|nr:hypothetical protein TREES_T100012939 [Tupaia chinensis]
MPRKFTWLPLNVVSYENGLLNLKLYMQGGEIQLREPQGQSPQQTAVEAKSDLARPTKVQQQEPTCALLSTAGGNFVYSFATVFWLGGLPLQARSLQVQDSIRLTVLESLQWLISPKAHATQMQGCNPKEAQSVESSFSLLFTSQADQRERSRSSRDTASGRAPTSRIEAGPPCTKAGGRKEEAGTGGRAHSYTSRRRSGRGKRLAIYKRKGDAKGGAFPGLPGTAEGPPGTATSGNRGGAAGYSGPQPGGKLGRDAGASNSGLPRAGTPGAPAGSGGAGRQVRPPRGSTCGFQVPGTEAEPALAAGPSTQAVQAVRKTQPGPPRPSAGRPGAALAFTQVRPALPAEGRAGNRKSCRCRCRPGRDAGVLGPRSPKPQATETRRKTASL